MKIAIFSGAGISAESGLDVFRGNGGLWEGYNIQEVANYNTGWLVDKQKVITFYNLRRKGVREAEPNVAHIALAKLEEKHEVTIVTQNIDDLHERGGSTNVIHVHGEIMTVKSDSDPYDVYPWREDLHIGDCDPLGVQLRPNVVWFGEGIYRWEECMRAVEEADVLITVGTSANVYPAAYLMEVDGPKEKYIVDPNAYDREGHMILRSLATVAIPQLVNQLLK